MQTSKTFKRNVWRGKRSKLTLSLHPDIVDVIRHVSKEQMLPMSVVADEVMYQGLKEMGLL